MDKKEIIPDIPDEILDFFRSIYNEAFRQTIADSKLSGDSFTPADHLSLFQHIETSFQKEENALSDVNYILKTCFLLGIQDSIKTRRFTMGMTNFMEDITVFAMYVVIWFNCLEEIDPIKMKTNLGDEPADMKSESRRKGAESDLVKCLSKAWEYQCEGNDDFLQPPVIRDRFGLRLIFYNSPELMLKLTKIITQILVNPEAEYTKSFRNWVNTCQRKFGGVEIPKDKINYILNFSFYVDNIKDYITNPKPDSSYQAWQATIHISGTSPVLGGFMFELQSQTWDMYKNNEDEDGTASHYQHKLRSTHGAIKAFKIENYDVTKDSGMVFFDGPGKPELDMDGITTHAKILSRHVSPHVI